MLLGYVVIINVFAKTIDSRLGPQLIGGIKEFFLSTLFGGKLFRILIDI